MIADAPPPPAMLSVAPATWAGADALLRAALVVVDANIGAFCPAELYVYDEEVATTTARADQPGCRVYYRRAQRDTAWASWTDRTEVREVRVGFAAYVCAALWHERLHNQGFSHTQTGLMAATFIQPDDYPAACTAWARAITPERTRHSMIGNPNNPRREAVRKAQALARRARAAAEAIGKAHAPRTHSNPGAAYSRPLDAIGGP